jgi:hypothetical protein
VIFLTIDPAQAGLPSTRENSLVTKTAAIARSLKCERSVQSGNKTLLAS